MTLKHRPFSCTQVLSSGDPFYCDDCGDVLKQLWLWKNKKLIAPLKAHLYECLMCKSTIGTEVFDGIEICNNCREAVLETY